MKKTTIMLVTVLFMIIGYAAYNATVNIYGLGKISENISDFKVYLDNLKVNDTENTGINDVKDEFTIDNVNGKISVDIVNDSTEYDTESYLECASIVTPDKTEWRFDYTGAEQTFTAPMSGTYKLETWGAQGGSVGNYTGGYGSYSIGDLYLTQNSKIYINIGGAGTTGKLDASFVVTPGGYNGGGINTSDVYGYGATGGGATHISTTSGLLSENANNLSNLLIVSGGGGGSGQESGLGYCYGGSAGGISSTKGYSNPNRYYAPGDVGTQTTGFAFGKGGDSKSWLGSGGAGLYGGYSGCGGAGGSSYIGNSLLTEKSMYCYNCTESTEESTRTISTTCTSATPTENCAKQGNGYARITLVSSDEIEKISTEVVTIEAQDKKKVTLENINTGSLTCKLKVNKLSRTTKEEKYIGPTEWTFDYTGSEQTFTVPISGTYKLETWGAQGGNAIYTNYSGTGGKGSYAGGVIEFNANTKIYVYVGGKGTNGNNSRAATLIEGGYNGGGNNQSLDSASPAGGGATDIRLTNGLWNNFDSLKSRIMVAGAGGGSGIENVGAPGGLNAGVYGTLYGGNGTSTSGGAAGTGYSHNSGATNGTFGVGGNGGRYITGAGGSGYYGGGGGNHYSPATSGGGGGGSSFISGHDGCDAISENSTASNIIHTGQSIHYSGYYFTQTIMKSGDETMPSHDGKSTMTGNSGNGYARITLIK